MSALELEAHSKFNLAFPVERTAATGIIDRTKRGLEGQSRNGRTWTIVQCRAYARSLRAIEDVEDVGKQFQVSAFTQMYAS